MVLALRQLISTSSRRGAVELLAIDVIEILLVESLLLLDLSSQDCDLLLIFGLLALHHFLDRDDVVLQDLMVLDTLMDIVNQLLCIDAGILGDLGVLLAQVLMDQLVLLQLAIEGLHLHVALVLELDVGIH